MCMVTGICGTMTGLCGVLTAVALGGAGIVGGGMALVAACCIGTCGVMSVIIYLACMLCGGSVLAVFGISIADIMAGGTVGGYLGYLGTFIDQGGNIYDACRICVAGK